MDKFNVNSDLRNNDVQTLSLGNELKKQLQRFPAMEKMFQLGAATLLDTIFKKVLFVDTGNVKAIEDKIMNLMRSEYTQEASAEPVPVTPHESVFREPHR